MHSITSYIIDFLARFPVSELGIVHYGKIEDASDNTKIIIIPAFDNFNINKLPETPFKHIDNTPVLYGDSKIERQNNVIIVYADIIASSFFLLSRYEEILKPECRDTYGRFLARDAVVFQQGYGYRPLVDEYGDLFRKWLREVGADVPAEKKGFSRIYLTHDVDRPFRFERFSIVIKQIIKNILRYNYCANPIKKYYNEQYDDNYTYPKIIEYDKYLQKSSPEIPVESIYFFFTTGTFFNNKYYNFFSKKVNRLITSLLESGAKIGLHISHEAGINPQNIQYDVQCYKSKFDEKELISRHHYLRWCEPEDIMYMEQAGITDDFSLSYADSAGFRVGTCRPYQFINPKTKELSNVIIHPLEVMECSLSHKEYMNLEYEEAFNICKNIISQVYYNNGELNLLWHNTEFLNLNYQEKLYKSIINYIKEQ